MFMENIVNFPILENFVRTNFCEFREFSPIRENKFSRKFSQKISTSKAFDIFLTNRFTTYAELSLAQELGKHISANVFLNGQINIILCIFWFTITCRISVCM